MNARVWWTVSLALVSGLALSQSGGSWKKLLAQFHGRRTGALMGMTFYRLTATTDQVKQAMSAQLPKGGWKPGYSWFRACGNSIAFDVIAFKRGKHEELVLSRTSKKNVCDITYTGKRGHLAGKG